jgi:hypothetical protein
VIFEASQANLLRKTWLRSQNHGHFQCDLRRPPFPHGGNRCLKQPELSHCAVALCPGRGEGGRAGAAASSASLRGTLRPCPTCDRGCPYNTEFTRNFIIIDFRASRYNARIGRQASSWCCRAKSA